MSSRERPETTDRSAAVRSASGSATRVVVFEEEPVRGGLYQGPGALQLAAAHLEGDLAGGDGRLHRGFGLLAGGEVEDAVVFGGVGARVPDDDLTGAVLAPGDDALEGGIGDGVVLGHDGVAADGGVAGGATGDGPRLHDAADLEAEVVVEARGVVLLDDEGEGSGAALGDGVGGLGRGREVALLAVAVEGLGHVVAPGLLGGDGGLLAGAVRRSLTGCLALLARAGGLHAGA